MRTGLSRRSVANIVAPMLFAWTYNWSVAGGRDFPAAMFLVRMVVGAILPELFFRFVPSKERLRLEEQSIPKRRYAAVRRYADRAPSAGNRG